ncbi:hypothetical protein SISNIDRAFT_449822 [Sistotremastrum niveocremeum HHB9708]|uniref:Uncharacterized protein n=1 Tax=Sistotremastrum niveocremeum HHB9708 TaxID=1314777 RepID=A0A164YNV3_9AGAM|nr:hypothetical protein SISNIDRAFT_449822 [Sistotremastrum niveocremeum HHB9708]
MSVNTNFVSNIHVVPEPSISEKGSFWPSRDAIGSLGLDGISPPTDVVFHGVYFPIPTTIESRKDRKLRLEQEIARSYQGFLEVPHVPAELTADDVALADSGSEDFAVSFQFPPKSGLVFILEEY